MNTKNCGHCVPVETHNRLARKWNIVCWLCVLLMLLVALIGVQALEWRHELAETRWALDNVTQQRADAELTVPIKPVKARRVK